MIYEIWNLGTVSQKVSCVISILTNPCAKRAIIEVDDDQVPSAIPLPQPMKSAEYPYEGMAA